MVFKAFNMLVSEWQRRVQFAGGRPEMAQNDTGAISHCENGNLYRHFPMCKFRRFFCRAAVEVRRRDEGALEVSEMRSAGREDITKKLRLRIVPSRLGFASGERERIGYGVDFLRP